MMQIALRNKQIVLYLRLLPKTLQRKKPTPDFNRKGRFISVEMTGTCKPIIALMCGSFNPVTRMHLQMMKVFKQFMVDNKKFNGSVVRGIISPVNDLYHVKRKNLLPSFHRITMINLALNEEGLKDWVECNPWESEQKEWQNTIKVLNYHSNNMKKTFGESTQLWMVCGADLIESMAIPGLWADKDLENIVKNYKLFIIPRVGSNADKFVSSHAILSRHLDSIVIANNLLPNDDSSTKIRAAIKVGYYPVELTYGTVIDYIKLHNLYKE